MTSWTAEELKAIGDAHELLLSSLRKDDTLRPPVIIWVVRVGDDLYIRSGYGRTSPWFTRAQVRHAGSVTADGMTRDVVFEDADKSVDEAVTAAYHAKYDRFGNFGVAPMVEPLAVAATFKLFPR
jgi:hypothetical protein